MHQAIRKALPAAADTIAAGIASMILFAVIAFIICGMAVMR